MSVGEILSQFWMPFLEGLGVTVALAAFSLLIGLAQGVFLGAFAARHNGLRVLVRTLFVITSSVPLIILLYWAHYPLQVSLGVVWPPFWVATGVLSQVAAALTSECVSHALVQLPRELTDQARAVGLSRKATFRHLVLPILVARLSPDMLNIVLAILQGTLFASLISVPELFRTAQQINATIHAPIQIYSALAFFFFAVCAPLFVGAQILRLRLRREGMLY